MTAFYENNLLLIQLCLVYFPLAVSFQTSLTCGLFSFIGVAFFGMGAYAAAILSLHGAPTVVAMLVPVLGAGVLGYGFAILVRRLNGLYLAMVTLAIDLIFGVLIIEGGTLTGGAAGLFGVPLYISTLGLVAICVVVAALIAQLERGAVGRGLRALRVSEDFASCSGHNVGAQRKFILTLSSVLGAISGVTYVSVFTTVEPTTADFGLIVSILTMVVIGGMASWRGAAIGVVIITWMPQVLQFTATYQSVVYGIGLALVTMYMPGGVFGVAGAISNRWPLGSRDSDKTFVSLQTKRKEKSHELGK